MRKVITGYGNKEEVDSMIEEIEETVKENIGVKIEEDDKETEDSELYQITVIIQKLEIKK